MGETVKMTKKVAAAIDELVNVLHDEAPKSVARLIMVVDYDLTPDSSELESPLDKARELGGVEVAKYIHHAPTRESLA